MVGDVDTGAVIILIILPLGIGVLAQITLTRQQRAPNDNVTPTKPDDHAAEVLGTAGLNLLVKPAEEFRPAAPSRRLSVVDALATAGGSLLVTPPDRRQQADKTTSPVR
jgi:hypothetical protein